MLVYESYHVVLQANVQGNKFYVTEERRVQTYPFGDRAGKCRER